MKQSMAATVPDDKSMSPYLDDLHFIFTSDRVRNAAVTGPFGSGKSSLINYVMHSDKFKSTKIAVLSTINFIDPTHRGLKNTNEYRNSIELGILNQLIQYSKEFDLASAGVGCLSVPINKKRKLFVAIYLSIMFLIGTLVYSESLFESIVIRVSLLLLFSLMVGMVGYFTLSFLGGINTIKKLSVSEFEIELDNNGVSVIDQNLQTIINLIISSSCDCFVFEDLDRAPDVAPMIIEELVFLNRCVNLRKGESENPVKFIYLISDDLYISDERVKLFDFILPVVPYVDLFSAKEHLIDNVVKYKLNISNELINAIAPGFSEARLVVDFFNEIMSYKSVLGLANEEDDDGLAAVVAYKIFFPDDFALFQQQKGFLYSLLVEANLLSALVGLKPIPIVYKYKEGSKRLALLSRIFMNNEELHLIDELNIDNSTIVDDRRYPVIKNLIIQQSLSPGLINYISHGSSSLSWRDAWFLSSISSGNNGLGWEYQIDSCPSIVSLLSDVDFATKKSLDNFYLFDFLLRSPENKVAAKLESELHKLQFKNDFSFILNYLNSEIYNSGERIEKFEASISNYLLSLLQNSESIDIDPEALALLLFIDAPFLLAYNEELFNLSCPLVIDAMECIDWRLDVKQRNKLLEVISDNNAYIDDSRLPEINLFDKCYEVDLSGELSEREYLVINSISKNNDASPRIIDRFNSINTDNKY